MALLDEIAAKLIADAVGVVGSTANWVVKKGRLFPSPDRQIVLTETGGLPNEGHKDNPLDRPTFQVRVRGPKGGYSTARTKMEAVRTSLHSVFNTSLSGRYYTHILAQSEPMGLPEDENGRPALVLNFLALRSRTT